jgi:hypothetical protein
MAAKKVETVALEVKAPNFREIHFKIRGIEPLVQNAFPEKVRQQMQADQEAGRAKKKVREPKDFNVNYMAARHLSTEGWDGLPAMSLKHAMVGACRTVPGMTMVLTKVAVRVLGDGYDKAEPWTHLVKITKGEPVMTVMPTRNANGMPDLRARPMWAPGWEATVRVQYDADLFKPEHITNLMMRAGIQGGVGEGRMSSPKSVGMGWGSFEIVKD